MLKTRFLGSELPLPPGSPRRPPQFDGVPGGKRPSGPPTFVFDEHLSFGWVPCPPPFSSLPPSLALAGLALVLIKLAVAVCLAGCVVTILTHVRGS